MWTSLGATPDNSAPSSRTKHSATLLGNYVYVFGGRNGNLPLKDFWRYSLSEGKWERLEPTGDRPPSLQEHSAVAFKDAIYVFGGEIGFSAGTETPLWIYDTKENSWRKLRGRKGVSTPKGRRGHTAFVYKGSMIVYGGYQDLRGSSNELWTYHFETESWHLISPKSSSSSSSSSTSSYSIQRPSGRHKHSAVLHDGAMWIYGGMTDLQEKGDLWRWDIASKTWFNIKTKTNPGPLHSHAVCKLPSSMLIFGGETNGLLLNDLWRFHFGTEVWEKLQFPGSKPHPRAESIALTISDVLFKENSFDASATTTVTRQTKNDLRFMSSASCSGGHNRNKNNKIGPAEKKYVFSPNGNLVTSAIQNNNLNILKEITKLSSINLPLLNRKCSYSMLNSNESNDDSTESLLKGKEGPDSSENTPTRMIKSQSANVIAPNPNKKKLFPSLTPATDKMPYSIVESVEFSISSSEKSSLSRDPVSVPNFKDFGASSSPSCCPATTDKLVNLESEPLNKSAAIDSTYSKPSKLTNFHQHNLTNNGRRSAKDSDSNRINLPGTPISSSEAPLKLKKNENNYNFSKKCQSDSYTSHLANVCDEDGRFLEKTDGIPKSASVVRFKKQPEIADETSDYCSIETVNKVISSSSNYSHTSSDAQRELLNDYPELRFPGGGSQTRRERGKTPNESGYGFSNPHYMGPDVHTILKTKEVQKALNSPPDSVLEDAVGKSSNKENVELKSLASEKGSGTKVPTPKQPRSPPRYLPLRGSPYNATTVPISDKKKKFRANSAGRSVDKQEIYSRYLQKCDEFSSANVEPGVPLSVFLIGGKEHGQITVFKRPISLWKLRLSSNVY